MMERYKEMQERDKLEEYENDSFYSSSSNSQNRENKKEYDKNI